MGKEQKMGNSYRKRNTSIQYKQKMFNSISNQTQTKVGINYQCQLLAWEIQE